VSGLARFRSARKLHVGSEVGRMQPMCRAGALDNAEFSNMCQRKDTIKAIVAIHIDQLGCCRPCAVKRRAVLQAFGLAGGAGGIDDGASSPRGAWGSRRSADTPAMISSQRRSQRATRRARRWGMAIRQNANGNALRHGLAIVWRRQAGARTQVHAAGSGGRAREAKGRGVR